MLFRLKIISRIKEISWILVEIIKIKEINKLYLVNIINKVKEIIKEIIKALIIQKIINNIDCYFIVILNESSNNY